MKKLLAGLCTALSLYSMIPVPKTKWDSDSMRYALCFFPLVGAVIAFLSLLWHGVCVSFGVGAGLFAAGAALIPLLVTGGIHMDGFMDTADAVSSHALREKKLEILKDPHVGAFGVLYCAGYLLLCYGLWQQLAVGVDLLPMVAAGYVVSRCCNALSIATFPTARKSGLVYLFADSAAKRAVVACSVAVGCGTLVFCVALSPLWGGLAAAVTVGYFLIHRRFCIWEFGGNTGDLAGFLLQNLELMFLILAVMGGLAA